MILAYPVKGAVFITQKYGENPDYYKQFKIGGVALKGHEGIDLRAPNGTEILACDEGICQEVLDQGAIGYGKYIKIIHSWGESVYAHLQEFKVKQGTKVTKGQAIALADNTGNSSGAHLHFGIRISPYNRADGWGGYSDPESFLFGEDDEMPLWAKNLQPFFIENQLKDDQVEGSVREAFEKRKIFDGFIQKWADKFQVEPDLGIIEMEIGKLLEMEDLHIELVSACEQLVGHFETENGLREALRGLKADLETLSRTNKTLIEERELLLKRKVLDRFEIEELIVGALKKVWEKIKEVISHVKKG